MSLEANRCRKISCGHNASWLKFRQEIVNKRMKSSVCDMIRVGSQVNVCDMHKGKVILLIHHRLGQERIKKTHQQNNRIRRNSVFIRCVRQNSLSNCRLFPYFWGRIRFMILFVFLVIFEEKSISLFFHSFFQLLISLQFQILFHYIHHKHAFGTPEEVRREGTLHYQGRN